MTNTELAASFRTYDARLRKSTSSRPFSGLRLAPNHHDALPAPAAKRLDKLSSKSKPTGKDEAEILALMELAGTFTPSAAYLMRLRAGLSGAGDPSSEVYAVAWGNDGKITYYRSPTAKDGPWNVFDDLKALRPLYSPITMPGFADLVAIREAWQGHRDQRIANGETDLPEVHVFPFDRKLCIIDTCRDLGFTREPSKAKAAQQLKLMEVEGTFTPAAQEPDAASITERKRNTRARKRYAANPQLDLWANIRAGEKAETVARLQEARVQRGTASRNALANLPGAPAEFTVIAETDAPIWTVLSPFGEVAFAGHRPASFTSVRSKPATFTTEQDARSFAADANLDWWSSLADACTPSVGHIKMARSEVLGSAFLPCDHCIIYDAAGNVVPNVETGFPVRIYTAEEQWPALNDLRAKPAVEMPAEPASQEDLVVQGLREWFGKRAYLDNAGNYRICEDQSNFTASGTSRGIAPWNKALKQAYPEGIPWDLREQYGYASKSRPVFDGVTSYPSAPFTEPVHCAQPAPAPAFTATASSTAARGPFTAAVHCAKPKPLPSVHKAYLQEVPTMSVSDALALNSEFAAYLSAVNGQVAFTAPEPAREPAFYLALPRDSVALGRTVESAHKDLAALAQTHAEREAKRQPLGRPPSAPRDAGVERMTVEVASDLHAAFTALATARSLTIRAAVDQALRFWLTSGSDPP